MCSFFAKSKKLHADLLPVIIGVLLLGSADTKACLKFPVDYPWSFKRAFFYVALCLSQRIGVLLGSISSFMIMQKHSRRRKGKH